MALTIDVFFDAQPTRETQYDARGSVDDFPGYMRRYAERAHAARRHHPGSIDLPYGPGVAERLDIFPAPGARLAPVFVFIHGGYWRALSKEDMHGVVPALTQAGVAVVALEYTLAPEATLAEIVREVRSAVAWLHAHGRVYGLDPDRIHVSGSSAGGHLAAMLMAPEWPARYGLPDNVIKGAVALSGLFDLRPLCDTVVNSWLQLTEAQAWALSPMSHVPPTSAPLILAVGEQETLGFKRQTQAMHALWQQHGLPVSMMEVDAADHFSIVFDLADEKSGLFKATLDMILRGS